MVARDGSGPRRRPATAELQILWCGSAQKHAVYLGLRANQTGMGASRQVDEEAKTPRTEKVKAPADAARKHTSGAEHVTSEERL